MAKAEAMADETRLRKTARNENCIKTVEPSKDPVQPKLKKVSTTKVEMEAMELSGLPKDFFKPFAD